MMFSSVTAGLMSSGRNIAESDIVPTPALQFATKALGYRGSVMITACHSPAQYNGVKLIGQDGVEVSRLDEQRIEKIFHDGLANKANWKDVGTASAGAVGHQDLPERHNVQGQREADRGEEGSRSWSTPGTEHSHSSPRTSSRR